MGVSIQERQFVELDRATSSRYFELMARECIASQDVTHWLTDYNQLSRFAEQNAGNPRVAQGWREEKPRYANAESTLRAKVCNTTPFHVDYTPRLYDMSVRGFGSPCGGGPQITQPTLNNYQGGSMQPVSPRTPTTINIPPSSVALPSLGDAFKSLLGIKPYQTPTIDTDYPDSPLINQGEITTGVITALVVGVILYIIHRATKK